MFKCKVCVEKENRVLDLQSQIEYLKSLIYNPNDASKIPFVNIEMNKTLDAADDIVEVNAHNASQDWLEEQRKIDAERIALLSANY